MTAITYDHSPAHVRDGITAAQERAWKRIASAGVWLDGERRVAIAAETRNAPGCKLCAARKEALSPYSVDGAHDNLGALPDDVVEVIHRIATDPGRLMQRWYDEIIAAGLADTDYVETVGVVVTIVSIDTFARALGVAPLALPDPVAGAPSRKRPAGAKHGGAWVPWIAPEDLTQDETDMGLYAGGPAAHIRRALSLVPAEALGFFDLVENQYLEGRQMRDFGNEFRAITHGQIELIAARISALNQCVYWTTSHVQLLRASSRHSGEDIDYNAILGETDGDVGVPHADVLVEFAEAILDDGDARLNAARQAVLDAMGADALGDAAGVAATFNAIDRIADATGIPLEDDKAEDTADLREDLGIDAFAPPA